MNTESYLVCWTTASDKYLTREFCSLPNARLFAVLKLSSGNTEVFILDSQGKEVPYAEYVAS